MPSAPNVDRRTTQVDLVAEGDIVTSRVDHRTPPADMLVEGEVGTSRLSVIDVPNEPGLIEQLQVALDQCPLVSDASIVDVTGYLGMPEWELTYVDRTDVLDRKIQEVIIRSVRWPSVMQALIVNSAVVTANECRLTVRTDRRSGALAESFVRNETFYLNRLKANVKDGNSFYRVPLIEARQFSLRGVHGKDVDTVIHAALLWANESPARYVPWWEYTPLPSHPNADPTCLEHMEAVLRFVEGSKCIVGPRRSPTSLTYGARIVVMHPPFTPPVVELKVHAATVFERDNYPPIIGDAPPAAPIVDDAPPARRDLRCVRSHSPAGRWLNEEGDDQPFIDDGGAGGSSTTQQSPTEDLPIRTTRDPRSELVESGGGGRGHTATAVLMDAVVGGGGSVGATPNSIGNIVSGVGLPTTDGIPVWVCDRLGNASDRVTGWYGTLRGHGCDEAAIMGVVLLSQYSPEGYQSAQVIVEYVDGIAWDRPLIDNPSGLVWSRVLACFHRMRPEGAQFSGMVGDGGR